MKSERIKKLYALGRAGWYDSFKAMWNKFVVSGAEAKLESFLKNNLDETKSVLELGCGTALNLAKIFSLGLKFKKYLGLDLSEDMLKIAKYKFSNVPEVTFRQKDITELNDINEKFDIILCTWVLSHLNSPSNLVNRAQKLLNPHGKFFIIFFSEPKWYLRFWLYPLAKYAFSSQCVFAEEIRKFNNVKTKESFSANIATVIEICRN